MDICNTQFLASMQEKQTVSNKKELFNIYFLGRLHISESCTEKQTGDNHLNSIKVGNAL